MSKVHTEDTGPQQLHLMKATSSVVASTKDGFLAVIFFVDDETQPVGRSFTREELQAFLAGITHGMSELGWLE